jgi:predicted acylesterase/phospholipase RssA
MLLGAAWHLQRQGLFDRATTFSGTSIGAVIAAGVVLGRTCRGMLEIAIRYPMRPDVAFERFGMDSGRGLEAFIRRVLGLQGTETLADVHARTHKTVRICVCNVTTRLPEYWTHETHPDVLLTHALRISCSIPFVFATVEHAGHVFVDGAVVDPLPVSRPTDALAVGFADRRGDPVRTTEEFIDALRVAARAPSSARYVLRLESRDVIDAINLSPTPREMRAAFASGRHQASKWTKKIK